MLHQSVQADPRETVADLFGATPALALLHRAERGDADAEALARADWILEARMATALGRLGLQGARNAAVDTVGRPTHASGLAGLASTSPTSSCSMSRPTASTATDGGRSSTFWQAGAAARSSSAMTATARDARRDR